MERYEQLERDRQREADRLASEANPPKPAEPLCWVSDPHSDDRCALGTLGCTIKHGTYAERLKASNERVKAGQNAKHDLQD